MTDPDLDYLRQCLEAATFTPFDWNEEDCNLAAFRSKEELIRWYCQPPGAEGQPYRDRGFYCRELAYLSRTVQPRTVVEFGTSLGIGTCLLRWLNPEAHLLTVDCNTETFLSGDVRVPIGNLAKHEGIHCCYIKCDSALFERPDVQLCFIDADHSYEAVVKDSWRAWANRACDRWAIAWHDYNEKHLGIVQAVKEFCAITGLTLQSRPDSDTVWVTG